MTRFGGFFLLWACQFENEKTAVRRLVGLLLHHLRAGDQAADLKKPTAN